MIPFFKVKLMYLRKWMVYLNNFFQVCKIRSTLKPIDFCLAHQKQDTTVRWSAAKAVARIAERLPEDFADQVLETIMSLFAIHSIAAATLYDIPAIAEGTWHGACLACAEMARRNLVSTANLPQLIDWLSKVAHYILCFWCLISSIGLILRSSQGGSLNWVECTGCSFIRPVGACEDPEFISTDYPC